MGVQAGMKEEAEREAQDYNECSDSNGIASTYISRQCGLEKTDECNKHLNSSVCW
jgi:hypothetical protein